MFTPSPVPSSKPASRVRRGTTSTCQWKCSAPRGAVRTQRFSGGGAPRRVLELQQALVQQARAPDSDSAKLALVAARHELQLVRATRDAKGASRTASSSTATTRSRRRTSSWSRSHSRQPPIVRVLCAVKRSRSRAISGGHEVERVELRVRVLERCARGRALVHHHVHAGGIGVRAGARAPARDGAARTAPASSSVDRATVLGRVDDHLVVARSRRRSTSSSGSPRPLASGSSGARRLARLQQRVLVRHRAHEPAGRVGRAAARVAGVGLGRSPALVALAQRALLARTRRATSDDSKLKGRSARAGASTTRRPVSGSIRSSGARHSGGGPAGALAALAPSASRNGREEVDRHREDRGRVALRADLDQRLEEAQLDRDRVLADRLRRPARACRRPGTRPRRR